jgi:Ser/Thr protein kinase RdoA (MazF antagonist)
MVDWVEGEKLAATQAEMEALGRGLGRLHAASERLLADTRGSDYTVRYLHKCLRLHRMFRLRLPLLTQRSGPVGRWFRRHGKRSLALLEECVRMLRQPEAKAVLDAEPLRPAIIHGDVTRPNVIRRKDRIYIIDWDRSRQGSIYQELVMVLANVTHFSLPLVETLLRGYEGQRPLQPAERQVVAALFRLPVEVWHAARHIALGRGTRLQLFRTVEKTWVARVAAIAWLDRWAAKEAAEPQPPAEAKSQAEVLPPAEELQPPPGVSPQAEVQPEPEVQPQSPPADNLPDY